MSWFWKEARSTTLLVPPPVSSPVAVIEQPPISIEEKLGKGFTLSQDQIKLAREEFAPYLKLAEEVGIKSTPMFERALEIFLAENNIPIYDSLKVHKHLREMAKKIRKSYVWLPLRAQDRNGTDRTGIGYYCHFQHRERYELASIVYGVVEETVYARIVPISVLMTVKKISGAFPQARFFVSDFSVPKPDPFLAVAVPGSRFWIVDFWAEPGFKP